MSKSFAEHYSKLSTDQGYMDAQFNYGLLLEKGDDILMDRLLAAHYFKLAADQGHANERIRHEALARDNRR
jgi:TPR repeat protein